MSGLRPSGRGRRVLIVEDEIAVALELECLLADAGFEPVGPAVTWEDALSLAAKGCFDGAVLDVGLLERRGRAVMDVLQARRIPFIYLTGFAIDELPPDLPAAPTLQKPSHLPDLVEGLERVFRPLPNGLA
jgi:CheY-like chemotaxis protein